MKVEIVGGGGMTEGQMAEVARGRVERYLGEDQSPDAIFSEAFTLGFDALTEAGVPRADATRVAYYVAQGFAQP